MHKYITLLVFLIISTTASTCLADTYYLSGSATGASTKFYIVICERKAAFVEDYKDTLESWSATLSSGDTLIRSTTTWALRSKTSDRYATAIMQTTYDGSKFKMTVYYHYVPHGKFFVEGVYTTQPTAIVTHDDLMAAAKNLRNTSNQPMFAVTHQNSADTNRPKTNVDPLNAKIRFLEDRLSKLSEKNLLLQSLLHSSESDNDRLKNEISKLKDNFEAVNEEAQRFKNDVAVSNTEVWKLSKDLQNKSDEIGALKAETSQLKNDLQDKNKAINAILLDYAKLLAILIFTCLVLILAGKNIVQRINKNLKNENTALAKSLQEITTERNNKSSRLDESHHLAEQLRNERDSLKKFLSNLKAQALETLENPANILLKHAMQKLETLKSVLEAENLSLKDSLKSAEKDVERIPQLEYRLQNLEAQKDALVAEKIRLAGLNEELSSTLRAAEKCIASQSPDQDLHKSSYWDSIAAECKQARGNVCEMADDWKNGQDITPCVHTNRLHTHHIKPISAGGLSIPSNLINLCIYHHSRMHKNIGIMQAPIAFTPEEISANNEEIARRLSFLKQLR